ncbi:MAG: hypothetical protein ACI4J0_05030 [Huintestinicola sp.]|uniref:hypothetical protein n=1 Tax=Huintestinicola sp. TaxID=2981661 RepID=UPI003F0D4990
MIYPDYEFYRSVFGGAEEEEVIMPFIRCAADILGGYVLNDHFSREEQVEFFRAVCAQAEFISENEGFSSVKIGDISAEYADAGAICPRAAAILERAGHLFRGDVEVRA